MKTSETIIAHLLNKPHNRKIAHKKCIHRLLTLLPRPMAEAVAFFYIKNGTLFFVLRHPGLKMEFHYKQNLIKTLLNKIKDIERNCDDLAVERIVSFVTNKIPEPPSAPPKPLRYPERAKGRFEIVASDAQIRALFEEIQEVIRKR